ncbi:unnamed protein product [Rotaria sp. Silwood2]|nr:unnamed protein product [Rotaria sp. Silwood2]CAF2629232.1 unnamed protein product [Rotaria sp. Silwood2]CAF2921900.1 unnamed protein product [Rotaria sp. Silwood2]CAF3041899.1 unnamed protein product [Rotaria sp. Silwood2]CAF3927951.1 unnamed protein product [Rotaria sp. Silwood2]
MVECYNAGRNETIMCPVNTAVYFVVGVIVPFIILIIVIVISAYFRYRNKWFIREQQQTNMTTVTSINNTDEHQQESYNYSHPPRYSARIDSIYGKPPSYEQTVQQLQEINDAFDDTTPTMSTTILSSSTTQLVQPS